jgi:hypothetical protein
VSAVVRGKALVVVTVIAGTSFGSIAWAAIPDSTGVIHACYANKGGALRVIDTAATTTCKSTEQPLTWNQQGIQGPAGQQGPQGLKGDPGVQGPAGAAAAYQARFLADPNTGNPQPIFYNGTPVPVLRIYLPEGSFVIDAYADDQLSGPAMCALISGGTTLAATDAQESAPAFQTLSITVATTSDTDRTIELQCGTGRLTGGGAGSIWEAGMTAIQVTTLSNQ